MRSEGTRERGNKGTREQENEGPDRLALLLRKAVSPVDDGAGPRQDMWPAMARRLRAQRATPIALKNVPWFDWALAGGVALFSLAFPVSVPVLLYYL